MDYQNFIDYARYIIIKTLTNALKKDRFTHQRSIQPRIFFEEAMQSHALRLFDSPIFRIDHRHVQHRSPTSKRTTPNPVILALAI